ncbi:unnamed protein product [Eruca vesicaria subsp. sativa]|uniref:Uncharacterized protein n=1 Tax=Eruca vesicaria subsp. sativa TaxID=29727 RepID=A0ABC8LXV6_ERUVS|nr:unnamed protein product [Eruca vesicaria subsp. sativa]
MALKVLLELVWRVKREEILDWKDEDGNTVFHIAASMNQTEVLIGYVLDFQVLKLLHSTVNIDAKNLDSKTAMDLLQITCLLFSPEQLGFSTVL